MEESNTIVYRLVPFSIDVTQPACGHNMVLNGVCNYGKK